MCTLQLPGGGGLEQRRQHHLDLFICSGPLNVLEKSQVNTMARMEVVEWEVQ